MGAVGECAVTHHVLKFNPMDLGAIANLGHEWLFQKEAVVNPFSDDKKKKKWRPEPAVPEHDQSWKRPWLITDSQDKEFLRAFLARRETDKRSKLDCIVNVCLTEVRVMCKGDPDLTKRLVPYNEHLFKLYKSCEMTAAGPGTDVFAKDVTVKKRVMDEKESYKTTSMLVRISADALTKLEARRKEEEDFTTKFVKDFKEELKKGLVDFNGKIIQYKVDEVGRKQHSYFWVEAHIDGELLLRPVHGDWWAVRKDATRRGVEAHQLEATEEQRRVIKKEKEVEPLKVSAHHQRLLHKTEEARVANFEIGRDGRELSKQAIQKKTKLKGESGEDGMKQQWREESHEVDDDMDCQQCGDIDDDDYDQQMAAAGDDLALNPDDMQRMLHEDAPEEVVKELSDESEDEEAKERLDENGYEMDRIMRGKPEKSREDKEKKRESSSSPEPQERRSPNLTDSKHASSSAGSSAKKASEQSVKIKVKIIPSSLGKRPDGASAQGQPAAKKAKPAPPAPPPTAAEMRAAVAQDSHMCVKKLIEMFKIKTMGKEQQDKFLVTMKEMCLKTKKLVPDGPFKDHAIIQLKKPN